MVNTDHISSHAESDLSDPQAPSPPDSSSTSIESEPQTPEEHVKDVDTPMSGSDEDAEGSDDEDYDLDATHRSPSIAIQDDRSSSTPEAHSRKRKLSNEFEDEISRNPDLYGVRRSVGFPWIAHSKVHADRPSRIELVQSVALLVHMLCT